MLSLEVLKFIFKYNPDGSFVRIGKLGTSGSMGKKTFGTICKSSGYSKISINKKAYYFHRIVFFYHTGLMPKYVDHINGNRADNRIENLREATSQENAFNRTGLNTQGIKGIWFSKSENTWRAQIKIGPKRIQLRNKNKEELIKTLKNKRKELHGNFARN